MSLEKAQDDATARGLGPDDARAITYDLQPVGLEFVQSLERVRSNIELLNVVIKPDRVRATARVPNDKFEVIDRIFKRYQLEEDKKSQKPKHQKLVESIDALRLSVSEDYWTDATKLPEPTAPVWWEVWLFHPSDRTPEEVRNGFVAEAELAGLKTRDSQVTFQDRVVLLTYGALQQWSTRPKLLSMVAELRRAKPVAGGYAALPPSQQKVVIDDLLGRVVAPPEDAPSVCILDTGVNRAHPLLQLALREEDGGAVVKEWGPHDNDLQRGHGTTMAGIALYGPIEELLGSDESVELTHRLESVKILPNAGHNEPELYGRITQDAVATAEIAAPGRNRVVSLATTTDALDGALPTSWSAALDQLAVENDMTGPAKLICVSAGNLRNQIHSDGFDYPMMGDDCGIEDPGQAFNAVTVGAMTERFVIGDPELSHFDPIAPPGDLSPTSRTSIPWSEDDQKWAIKPDVVEEGGNWARAGGQTDCPDDLGLLSTIVHPTGRLFTITRDTSPATAQVARIGAMVWAEYPDLWPETVRALIVHSARWTPAMVERFPGMSKADVQRRLRCYGYGRPTSNAPCTRPETTRL